MLVVQNELMPGTIQDALFDLLRKKAERIRICSAYISLSGSEMLFDAICRASSNLADKTIVASLDFGLTDPEALRFWMKVRNCSVFVAGSDNLRRGSLTPTSAYHTKFYVFDRQDNSVGSLVASANLTNRGLTVNSEVGWLDRSVADPAALNVAWSNIVRPAIPITQQILDAYAKLHDRLKDAIHTKELEPLPPPPIGSPSNYSVFGDAPVDPASYNLMWIQSRGMQGGAGTQLELPRGTHRYFGARYADYNFEKVKHIAEPILVSGRERWSDRPLTWHGDNAMERINLPSFAMGGFRYENSLILFRRLGRNVFELRVHPWESDTAHAYVEASRRSGLVYRVGRNSNRIAGFLP
ncbi:MAG: phospholipase D family protein [Bradyrhizobium sp.]|uniref:phospholipase D family protein n=1 Tax=Bradyrhizobium sp. TaxID=376 RepID=UPI0029A22942|nr:phospholipase D family protein [Bradyrhizobium sp.]MDX3968137.1 phospholipase D family protein [Bradyrhizobium sp.]